MLLYVSVSDFSLNTMHALILLLLYSNDLCGPYGHFVFIALVLKKGSPTFLYIVTHRENETPLLVQLSCGRRYCQLMLLPEPQLPQD
jgi:hypothetical protein